MPTLLRYLLATVLVLSWCEGGCRWGRERALGDLCRSGGLVPAERASVGLVFPVCQMPWLG